MLLLRIRHSPDDPGVLRMFSHASIVTVGRFSENVLVLQGAGVSRRHCALALEGKRVRVTDFRSTNGTWVNGEEIRGSALVDFGSTLKVGTVRLTLVDGAPLVAEQSLRRKLICEARRAAARHSVPCMENIHVMATREVRGVLEALDLAVTVQCGQRHCSFWECELVRRLEAVASRRKHAAI